MDYLCAVCEKYIKSNSKYKHSKSIIHTEIERNKHIILTSEIPDINDIDEILLCIHYPT